MSTSTIRLTSWAVTVLLLVSAVSLFVMRANGIISDMAVGWLLAGLIAIAIAYGLWRSLALRRANANANAVPGRQN